MRLACIFCLLFLTACATPPRYTAEFMPGERYYYDEVNYLNYRQLGEGRKTLILLHGYGSSGYNWSDLLPLLDLDDTRVLIFDLIGSGFSSRPRHHDYSIAANASIINDFIRDYKISEYSLMGHSFGGGVSLLVASQAQASASVMPSSLVLLDTVSYKVPPPIFITLAKIPVLSRASIKVLSPRLMAGISLSRVFHDRSKIRPEQVRRYTHFIAQDDFAEAITQMARDVVPPAADALSNAYKSLGMPVMIVWGEEDKALPLATGERLASELPNAQLVKIPDCGHNVQEECPEPVAQAVNPFFAGVFE